MEVKMSIQSIRYALRWLRKSPGFTATAVLTLSLAIGATSAVFSVFDTVLLEPLPYPASDRLVRLNESQKARIFGGMAPATLADYGRARAFVGLAGYARRSMSLTQSGPPEQLLGEAGTWNLFDVLGVSPAIGRGFRAEDDRHGAGRVVILTAALWRTRFGGDPAILGRSILLDGEPHVVIGVMPAGFQPLSGFSSGFTTHFFVPAALTPELVTSRTQRRFSTVGRLAPGVSVDAAAAELNAIAADLERRFPETNREFTAAIESLQGELTARVRLPLIVLISAVALVLLVASVNLAGLLSVRAVAERRDIAIRLALGATSARVAADMAIRTTILGLLGGAMGIIVGDWIRRALVAIAPLTLPRAADIALDGRVLIVTTGLSLAAGLIASVLPVVQVWRERATTALTSESRSVSADRTAAAWRGLLLATEIAAAVVLAIGAGLLVRSLVRLAQVDLGFQSAGVLMFAVRPPDARYPDGNARARLFEEIEQRMMAIPGVRSAGVASELPLRSGGSNRIVVGDRPGAAGFQTVSAGYFDTLAVPLVAGRQLTWRDRTGTTPVAVVSRTFVQRFMPDVDPIGQRFRRTANGPEITIVGVVGDVRRDGSQADLIPQVFFPAGQPGLDPIPVSEVAVRTDGDPRALVSLIRQAISSIDPDQPITNVFTLDEIVAGSTATRRFTMTIVGALAILAGGLAVLGVYGVSAFAAVQRQREIGIRVALGAPRQRLAMMVALGSLRWTLAGTAVGLAAAWWVTRFLRTLLFGIPPTDLFTFVAAALVTIAAAGLASYLPARRAASADPLWALRL
jgi:predicted permease